VAQVISQVVERQLAKLCSNPSPTKKKKKIRETGQLTTKPIKVVQKQSSSPCFWTQLLSGQNLLDQTQNQCLQASAHPTDEWNKAALLRGPGLSCTELSCGLTELVKSAASKYSDKASIGQSHPKSLFHFLWLYLDFS
jgi:hypothetical protein